MNTILEVSIESFVIFVLACIKYWSYRRQTDYIVSAKYHFINKLNNYVILYLTNWTLIFFDIKIIGEETWMFLIKYGLLPEMIAHSILIHNY